MPYTRWNNLLSYLTIFVVSLLLGCARLVPFPSAKPFSQEEIAHVISHLSEQEERIVSFQGIGRLRFKEGEEDSESDLFAVGRKPFKARLEITHPWGKPLFHIVVDESNISVLSLTENKFFSGPSNPVNTNRFFLCGLDLDSAWKILSGRVPILPHYRAASLRPQKISLYDRQDEVVEVISFSHGHLLPRSVYFPKKGITIVLSEFKEGDFGPYPLKIKIVKGDEDQLVEIQYKNLQVNKPIPEEIFRLNPPPDFEIIQLNYQESQRPVRLSQADHGQALKSPPWR